jgi:lysophospholipase L1-like esterase
MIKSWTILLLLGASLLAEEAPTDWPAESRVLFQGDSITDGARGRTPDPNHALGHGYVFLIAGDFGARAPEQRLNFLNRGVSGNTILDLAKRWPKDTLELKPDILSVLIGVNDAAKGVTPEVFEKTYDELLKSARAANPKLRLILCLPFTGTTGSALDKSPNRRERVAALADIVRKLAAKNDATLVDFSKVFEDARRRAPSEFWIWDGVHPTAAGHRLMAQEWARVVQGSKR